MSCSSSEGYTTGGVVVAWPWPDRSAKGRLLHQIGVSLLVPAISLTARAATELSEQGGWRTALRETKPPSCLIH